MIDLRRVAQKHTIVEEPRDSTYRELLSWLESRAASILLVVRDSAGLTADGHAVLARLQPFLKSRERRKEWPGTRLLAATATVYQYELSDVISTVLSEVADSLYSWQQPNLPEDLCFLAADGRILLATIAHEGDAYLDLTSLELASLRAHAPQLAVSRAD